LLVAKTIALVQSEIHRCKSAGLAVGFIPTMGALHRGHLSLLERSGIECGVSVVSIFVNPTQFNNPTDLVLYPRTLEKDLAMLEENSCHIVFVPSVKEIYPELKKDSWDFGRMSSTLEGNYRPGHFNGVLTVVKRLFEIIQPDKAYFGEKDFQQLSLIGKMVEREKLTLDVVPCPIVREPDGLAMSSRNTRLSSNERQLAANISRILFLIKERRDENSPVALAAIARREFEKAEGIVLEYFEIVDAPSFKPLKDWGDATQPIALVAAYVGEVRLIDNIRL